MHQTNQNENHSRAQNSPQPVNNTNHHDNKTSINNNHINNDDNKEISPDEAAVMIQSVYRGYKTRSELKNVKIFFTN